MKNRVACILYCNGNGRVSVLEYWKQKHFKEFHIAKHLNTYSEL
jgi:hypothetical protein